ncbi:MAG: DEAD/DEAH box helicase [Flavobacteriaceae bacterium]|nr:DEAD/DEAH box helicase [Flavobacteriaceae bacterium]MBT6654215.1 DEAD/DEAH box helicase [Flavobacteriaceae bacterium]MDC1317304.1 DEAD/DEAH box helicase [Flavobacteriaceae bacterium]MDC3182544.1 DEAD/DEAH box helicase [Flavobacteriaceae bacterium]
MNNFKNLGIEQKLIESISELGFENPTPVQEKAIPLVLNDRSDLIALAQTGTGKTAAFGLPSIQQIDLKNKNIQTIVLCPTRELCIQISKDLISYSKFLKAIKITPVYGGASIENQIKAIRKGTHIIVGTPGRTKDLIKRKVLNFKSVNRVVLDEADEMLSMGFKDDLDFILDTTSENRQTLLFSATMSKEVRSISKRFMNDANEITVEKLNSGSKNVEHHIYNVSSRDKYATLKRISDFNPEIYGIVFCRTRRETKDIASKFINDGYSADAIHGDLSQSQRDDVMSRFRDKTIQMLIATDVAARGLDVNSLTHVINYSLPDDPEVYTHRSGRTGRAGNKGISVVISNSRESRKIKSIENKSQIKFLKMDVPSGKDICSKQLFKLIEKIEKVKVDEKQISPFLPDIYEKLNWLSREDLIKHFVSAEFNRFLDYYKKSRDIKSDNGTDNKSKDFSKSRRRSKDFENLSVNVGRKQGITPIELISLVNRITKSNEIEIGSIDIRQSYTIFEIDKTITKSLIKSSSKLDHNGVDLKVTVSKEKIEKKYNREKSERRSKPKRDFKNKSRSRSRNRSESKGRRKYRG